MKKFKERLRNFLHITGLHPLLGIGVIAIDLMLFGETVATVGIGWVISIPVGVVLTISSLFIQRYLYKDLWGSAIGKSLLIGLITAIPTPLPSVLTATQTFFGCLVIFVGNSQKTREQPSVDLIQNK